MHDRHYEQVAGLCERCELRYGVPGSPNAGSMTHVLHLAYVEQGFLSHLGMQHLERRSATKASELTTAYRYREARMEMSTRSMPHIQVLA